MIDSGSKDIPPVKSNLSPAISNPKPASIRKLGSKSVPLRLKPKTTSFRVALNLLLENKEILPPKLASKLMSRDLL